MERKNDIFEDISREDLQREADKIRAEIENDPEFEKFCMPDEMHERMRARIQSYEEEKARESLSDADKDALRIGREMQKKRKKVRGRKSPRVWVALAATSVLVMGLGVTCFGSRERFTDVFGGTFGSGEKTYVDSSDEKIPGGENTEAQAYEDIKEMFGSDIVHMIYKPEDTQFLELELKREHQEALLYYSVGKKVLNYQIESKYVDGSTGMEIQDKLIQEYQIKCSEATINVREYQIIESGEMEYTAQFSYKNCKYFMYGVMGKAEFEKILKNLHFF